MALGASRLRGPAPDLDSLQECGALATVITAPTFVAGSPQGWQGPWGANFQIHPVRKTFESLVDKNQAGPQLSSTQRAVVSFLGAPGVGKSSVLRAALLGAPSSNIVGAAAHRPDRDIYLFRCQRTNTFGLDFEGVELVEPPPEEPDEIHQVLEKATRRRSSLLKSIPIPEKEPGPLPDLRMRALKVLMPSAAYALSDLIVLVSDLTPEECIVTELAPLCKACVSRIRNGPRPRLIVVCNRQETPRKGDYFLPQRKKKQFEPYFKAVNFFFLPEVSSQNFCGNADRLRTLVQAQLKARDPLDDMPGLEAWMKTNSWEWLGITYSIISWLNRPEPLVLLLAQIRNEARHSLAGGVVDVKLLNYLVAEVLVPYGEDELTADHWKAASGLVARFLRTNKASVSIKQWADVSLSLRQWLPCDGQAVLNDRGACYVCRSPVLLHGPVHRCCEAQSDSSAPFPWHTPWLGNFTAPKWNDMAEAKKAGSSGFDPYRAAEQLLVDYEGVAGGGSGQLEGAAKEKYLKQVIVTGGLKSVLSRLSVDKGPGGLCFICFKMMDTPDKIEERKRKLSTTLLDNDAHMRAIRVCQPCLDRVHFHSANRGIPETMRGVCLPPVSDRGLFYRNVAHHRMRGEQCLRYEPLKTYADPFPTHVPDPSEKEIAHQLALLDGNVRERVQSEHQLALPSGPQNQRPVQWKWDRDSLTWQAGPGRPWAGQLPEYVVSNVKAGMKEAINRFGASTRMRRPSGQSALAHSSSTPSIRLPSMTVMPPPLSQDVLASGHAGNDVCPVCQQRGPRCAILPCQHMYCTSCSFEWAKYSADEECAWLMSAARPPTGTFLGRIFGGLCPSISGRCAVCRVAIEGVFVLETLPEAHQGSDWVRSWVQLGLACKV